MTTLFLAVQRGEPTGLEGLLKACMQQAPTEALNALNRSSTLPQRRREACKHAAGILRLYNHLHVVMKVCHAAIHLYDTHTLQSGSWSLGLKSRVEVYYEGGFMFIILSLEWSVGFQSKVLENKFCCHPPVESCADRLIAIGTRAASAQC